MRFSYFLLVQSELDEDVIEISARSLEDLQKQFDKIEKAVAGYENEKKDYTG